MIKKVVKLIIPEKVRIGIRESLRKLQAPLLKGDKVYCNCCEKSFEKFMPKGNQKRLNALCPSCGSLERTRLLLAYLQNETTVFKKHQRVLHITPEKALSKHLKAADIDYVDGDINPNLATHVVDLTNIQFPNDSFDLIICSHVLGHIDDEPKAIQEMKRVLKRGAFALIMTVIDSTAKRTFEDVSITDPEDRLINFGEADLVRLHGCDFADRLKAQGFYRVTEIDYRDEFTQAEQERFRFGNGERELIFKCTK